MGNCSGKIAFGKSIKSALPRKLGTIGFIVGKGGRVPSWQLHSAAPSLPTAFPAPAWVLPPTAALQGQLFRGAALLQNELGTEHTPKGHTAHSENTRLLDVPWMHLTSLPQKNLKCIFSCCWKARSFIFCHPSPLLWDKILQQTASRL